MKNQDVVHITDKGLRDKTSTGLEAEILAYLRDTGLAQVEELGMNLKILEDKLFLLLTILERKGFIVITPFHKKELELDSPISHDLYHSALEENLASRAYHERAKEALKEGDKKTAELYEHIAHEEDVHEKEFNERLGER